MKVWMTIGYTDFEGDVNADKVFTNKEKAVDSILVILHKAWSDSDGSVQGHSKEEFIGKTKEYIMKDSKSTYWYLWSGCDFWKEIFSDWDDNANGVYDWLGIHEVDLID